MTPRHFSFNSPEGACSVCSGLGTKLEFDIDQIIPNLTLSIREGAIKPWSGLGLRGGIQNGYHRALEALSRKYKFSLDKPVKMLEKHAFEIVLQGDKELGYEGIVPALECAHAAAYAEKLARRMGRGEILVVNVSGRGDKDIGIVQEHGKA